VTEVPFYIGFSLNWDAPIDVGEAETAVKLGMRSAICRTVMR